MFDIFFDNAVVKSVISVVNFCKEQQIYDTHELKFLKNMPINKVESQTSNRYVFKAIRKC